jgi:hypothetical protein
MCVLGTTFESAYTFFKLRFDCSISCCTLDQTWIFGAAVAVQKMTRKINEKYKEPSAWEHTSREI